MDDLRAALPAASTGPAMMIRRRPQARPSPRGPIGSPLIASRLAAAGWQIKFSHDQPEVAVCLLMRWVPHFHDHPFIYSKREFFDKNPPCDFFSDTWHLDTSDRRRISNRLRACAHKRAASTVGYWCDCVAKLFFGVRPKFCRALVRSLENYVGGHMINPIFNRQPS